MLWKSYELDVYITFTGAACSTGFGSPILPTATCKAAAAAAAAVKTAAAAAAAATCKAAAAATCNAAAAVAVKTAQHGVHFVFQYGFLTTLLWVLSVDQYTATFAKSGDHPFQPRQLLEGGQHCITQGGFASPELHSKHGSLGRKCSQCSQDKVQALLSCSVLSNLGEAWAP